MKENKFIVTDATDVMCIGGFGNDKGNKGLLKYSEKEIAKMIMENNNTTDNTRLANSLLRTIRNQDNIINELEEYIKRFLYMLNGILDRDVYEQCQLDDFTMIMEKLQELKGDRSNE